MPTLEPITPTIRSSDESLFFTCPTLYYLVRRMGLTPSLRQSEALTLGSWFHTYMQIACERLKDPHTLNDNFVDLTLQLIQRERDNELMASCVASGITGDSARNVLDIEFRLSTMAKVFQEFAMTMLLPDRNSNLAGILSNFRILDAEPRLLLVQPGAIAPELPPARLVAQPDALLYHEAQKKVWIVDWKTCAGSARTRLATCPHEFQTQHYLSITQQLLPLLIAKYELHPDTKLAGVMHVALQKCPLTFGTKDRPYHYTADSKRSKKVGTATPNAGGWRVFIMNADTGELASDNWYRYEDDAASALNTGVGVKVEKTYGGEPSYDRYVARCRSWYNAEGEYQNLEVDRKPGDLIDISYTHNYIDQPGLDRGYSLSYRARLNHLIDASILPYTMQDFPRRADHLRQWGNLNPYFLFYENDFSTWGDVASRLSMTQNHRDKDLLDATDSAILPTPLASSLEHRSDGTEAPEVENEVPVC